MNILVVGASVRAAAASIRRAGATPIAFDLYRDADLAANASATQISAADYPGRIWELVRHLDPLPWMYTGAIENYPELIAKISTRFRLLGTAGSALKAVRNPFWLSAALRNANLLMPEIRHSPARIPTDGSWLVKPVASGGGERISLWWGEPWPESGPIYFQRCIAGLSLAALFVCNDLQTHLIGISRQFVGRPGNQFAYRGSLGPWPVSEQVRREVIRLGIEVARAGLTGLFGIDLIVAAGRVWLIEVNPRYTAAVEVLEAAFGRSILAEHLTACGLSLEADPATRTEPKPASVVGKVILFARTAGRLKSAIPIQTAELADIPHPGTLFEAGQPIMTVFGTGSTVAACRRNLGWQLRSWQNRLELVH